MPPQISAGPQEPGLSEQQRHVLTVMERTFACYIIEKPEAKAIKERLNELEAELAAHRNAMPLGYEGAHRLRGLVMRTIFEK